MEQIFDASTIAFLLMTTEIDGELAEMLFEKQVEEYEACENDLYY